MSKRAPGRHPRRERDFFPTPFKAVLPLLPFLHGVRRFAEPCVGQGDLVRHLEANGLVCRLAGDIATGEDALAIEDFGGLPVVTNPPWGRKTLHALIGHFIDRAPFAWLLLDLDWAATKQARPFMSHCTDVVVIGRVKWIPGSRSNGLDNCCWYRFEAGHDSGPVFHALPPPRRPAHAATCERCGTPFQVGRSDVRYCSGACRQAAYRERIAVTKNVTGTYRGDDTPSTGATGGLT